VDTKLTPEKKIKDSFSEKRFFVDSDVENTALEMIMWVEYGPIPLRVRD